LGNQAIPVIVPNLVLVEVAGAVSRTRNNPVQAQAFADALSRLPNVTLFPLDDVLSHQALELAAQYALRGADAVYAAVALQSSCVLVSLDNEHLTRLSGIVPTQTPAVVLTNLGFSM
jgi:predicted nucleic acid-binding protein